MAEESRQYSFTESRGVVREDEGFALNGPSDVFTKLLWLGEEEPELGDEAGGT